ncbi:MAG: 3',5'-cyclic-nucleotide phosphodiesterase [Gammaproteobacteria bacterium]|nr:3',5'-cyclic-nucleotide phosphodiesterase [Gammaproteobacteria bacterium]
MRIKVLGCSGGIGGNRRTTSFLIDDDTLLDAGTGVMDLEVDELVRVGRIFLTHTHLDHIAALPLMVDTVGAMRSAPIILYASCAGLATLKAHIFNWYIWPDFFRIPDADSAFLTSEVFEEGETFDLGAGRRIRALPVNHTVPAVGYAVSGPSGTLVFSGDTTRCPAFWKTVNAIKDLKYLIIETAFSENEKSIAEASKHLCPSMLGAELAQYTNTAPLYITHLKPREEDLIMEQVHEVAGEREVHRLEKGQLFEL